MSNSIKKGTRLIQVEATIDSRGEKPRVIMQKLGTSDKFPVTITSVCPDVIVVEGVGICPVNDNILNVAPHQLLSLKYSSTGGITHYSMIGPLDYRTAIENQVTQAAVDHIKDLGYKQFTVAPNQPSA